MTKQEKIRAEIIAAQALREATAAAELKSKPRPTPLRSPMRRAQGHYGRRM